MLREWRLERYSAWCKNMICVERLKEGEGWTRCSKQSVCVLEAMSGEDAVAVVQE